MLEERNKLKMKIFCLEPKNLNHSDWGKDDCPKKLIVRAEDEEKARNKAALTFPSAVENKSIPQLSPNNPWLSVDHVDCNESNDTGYSTDGDEEILYPNPRDF